MRLGKLSFPVQTASDEVTEQVKQLLEEKEWREYEIQKPELWFFPYWFFNYHSFVETADENGVVATSEGESGQSALNAQTGELAEELASLLDDFENELVAHPSEKEFKMVRFRIGAGEAERLTQLKIAAKYSIGKQSVVISGLKAVYVPLWLCDASIEGEQLEFRFNAVSGELESETEVPYRGKTGHELVGETVSDLGNPLNWIRYAIDIIKAVLGFLWNNPVSKWFRKELTTNTRFQIAVLLVILALIILNETGFLRLDFLNAAPANNAP